MKYLKSMLLVLLISSTGYSQEEEETENYEHILGVEFPVLTADFGLVYRRVYPKMNVKLGAYIGSIYNSNSSNNYLFPTQNPSSPFLLINRHFANERNNQLLEIGAEYLVKKNKYWRTYLGLDLVLENRVVKQFGAVNNLDSNQLFAQGSDYYNFETYGNESANSLESKYAYFGIGGNLRYQVTYEINPYFLVSVEIGVNYQHRMLYNSTFTYSNEEYKTHLPEMEAEDISGFNYITSFGVHYIF